jgi:hypothetical protein
VTVSALSADLTAAVGELERAFPGRVSIMEQDQSGAIVRIQRVELSQRWTPRTGDLWFLIPFHYPDAAIYPYYITDASPTGGLVAGLQSVDWRGMRVIQVSLRHSGWNTAHDTALGCVVQTQAWLLGT